MTRFTLPDIMARGTAENTAGGTEDSGDPMSPMSPLSPSATSAESAAEALAADRDYYCTGRNVFGRISEWGTFLRHTDVAAESSLHFDAMRKWKGRRRECGRRPSAHLSCVRVPAEFPHAEDV